MSDADERFEATLRAADDVVGALAERGAEALLIGAMALAVHRYPRDTVDLDLATAIDRSALDAVARALRDRGYEVEVHLPDAEDPLGGVIDVRAEGADLVQVVNFSNPPSHGFPRLVADAARTATPLGAGSAVRVVDLPHLIVFKLYAGGRKSALDILELLDRNPELDLDEVRALCRHYRMERQLDAVLGAS